MNDVIIKAVVSAVVSIATAVITRYLIPLIKEKIGDIKYARLVSFIKASVQWANQTIPPEEWQKKKQEVLNAITDFMQNTVKLNLSEEQLLIIMEAFVIECKKDKTE